MTTLARWQRFIQDQAGNVVPSAFIEVRSMTIGGTPLASLYSDRAGATPIGNPFQADSKGFAAFHATGDAYQVRAYLGPSGAPTFETIFTYEAVGTASEHDYAYFDTRQALSADHDYYVAPAGSGGSDSNAGTSGSPFLTINRALAVAAALDTAGFNVTVHCAAGTYTGAVTLRNMVGTGSVTITGVAADAGSATKTAFVSTAADCFNSSNLLTTVYSISNLKLKSTGGNGVNVDAPGTVNVTDCDLNGFGNAALRAANCGRLNESANFWSGASAKMLLLCGGLGLIQSSGVMSFQANAAFIWTVYADAQSLVDVHGKTFTLNGHTVTGQRYHAVNGYIFSNGAGANFIPGDSAGDTPFGGQYV